MGNKHFNYERLLKTPEWREYSKTKLKQDNYNCQICHQKKSENELLVHHKMYIEGKDIWDYPPELVETLCKDCHEKLHKPYKKYIIYRPPKPGYRLVTCNRCLGEGLLYMRSGKFCRCDLCDGTGYVYEEDIEPFEDDYPSCW